MDNNLAGENGVRLGNSVSKDRASIETNRTNKMASHSLIDKDPSIDWSADDNLHCI